MKSLYIIFTGIIIFTTSTVMGQGSIYGLVENSNLTNPADSELVFFGFLDSTDEELRIETCDGAGYEAGFWFDDFQNYLTESPNNPYDYYFYNKINGEGYHLAKLIPNNSFQEENIILNSVSWPSKPENLTAISIDTISIKISWTAIPDLTYHIYRRPAGSNGSFFRLDNSGGLLSDPGVADSFFIDNDVFPTEGFDYLLIAEDASGNYSPHSETVTAFARIQEIKLDNIVNGAGVINEYGFQDTIAAGKDVTFNLRFTNISGESECFYSISANFRIFSPDDAHWTYSIIDTVNVGQTEFDSFSMACFSCDGIEIDTIGLAGQVINGNGLMEGYDDIAFSITIKPDIADIGKRICIDTIAITQDALPPLSDFRWQWTGSSSCSADNVTPTWYDEPLCFYIAEVECCKGTTGNIDCSASEDPDISDITGLIDHLYLTHKPLCCFEEADVNGSGGDPDISDITTLIDNLYLSHQPLPDCP